MEMGNVMKIAVIGAGVSGLAATRRVTEFADYFECITFELSDNVGGTWVYTDKTGKDEYGIHVHSSMYQGLRTNLPKEIMEMPGFPHKNLDNRSYLTSAEILKYLQDYADHFDLMKHIKFRHHVNNVVPKPNGGWEINVTDLKHSKDEIYHFDAVIVCTGNYSYPVIPQIPNIHNFTGLQIHSHNFREPSMFKNQKVIVLGVGPSGMDIASHVCGTAEKVYLSHHHDKVLKMPFPKNLQHKPDIREIRDGKVVFVDGSEVSADSIIYCTGYVNKYTFLDPQCKIRVENYIVKPLYKQLINIEHPTMCIIGIPRDCPNFHMMDVQARCFLNILKGLVTLPSKRDMFEELEQDINERTKVPGGERYYHSLKHNQAKKYFDELTQLGNLTDSKPVMFDIYSYAAERIVDDFPNFRNKCYKIMNDHEFIVE